MLASKSEKSGIIFQGVDRRRKFCCKRVKKLLFLERDTSRVKLERRIKENEEEERPTDDVVSSSSLSFCIEGKWEIIKKVTPKT